jgi:hypothetical protein
MIESLAFSLVKTLISFMFDQHLENMQSVKLESAPKWYYQQTVDHICDSGHAYGRLEVLDSAKLTARRQMEHRLKRAMEAVSYEKYRDRTDPAERALVQRFSTDENLPIFVESSVIYENLAYHDNTGVAYARVCIPKERLVRYQEERVGELVKAVTLHRRDRALDELEADVIKLRPTN